MTYVYIMLGGSVGGQQLEEIQTGNFYPPKKVTKEERMPQTGIQLPQNSLSGTILRCRNFALSSVSYIFLERRLLLILGLSKGKLTGITIYGPKIYTAPFVMLLMRANPLRRQERGWALGDFFGSCEMASSRQASVILGPINLRFSGPNPLPLA